MLRPEDAAERLALSGRLGMDDPTETQSVRWYWNQVTGELNRSGWRDLRIPAHSATDSSVIRPLIPMAFGRAVGAKRRRVVGGYSE
jgi:hypothetical protein